MARKTARETALGTVQEMDALAARWTTEHDTALAELDRVTESLGEDALRDPATAATAPARMQTLRDRAAVAARAVDAAQAKALTARRAAIAAQAVEVEPLIEAAQAKLTRHEERVAVLLLALQDCAGQTYMPTGALEGDVVGMLTLDLGLRVREREILLAVADGRDPRESVPGIGIDALPASVRHDGVLPAPGLGVAPVDLRAQYRAELVEAERALADAVALVAEIEASPTNVGLGAAQTAVQRLTTEVVNIRGYVSAEV